MKTLQVIGKTEKERKKLNRRSKLFYVSCDYVEVNDSQENDSSIKSGFMLNVHSDPIKVQVDNSDRIERARKKNNRKSKLFYVNCEHFDINAGGQTFDSPTPVYSDSLQSLENSTDGESTPKNMSLPSSGRSTPSVKKRPKKPEIRISDFNTGGSYVEICRKDSICSIDSEYDGSVTSDESFMNIPESVIAQAVLNAQFPDSKRRLNELEETLKEPVDELSFKTSELQQICDNRPESPTSNFLKPLLHISSDVLSKELHCKLSPMLHKMKKLEEDSKKLAMLQVKLAVLQEEKRQLSMMLEEKRDSSFKNSIDCILKNSPSELTSGSNGLNDLSHKDVGVQKYYEIITEISHKQTSTDVEYDSVGIGDGVADICYQDKSTGNHVSSVDFGCQRDQIFETSNVSTNTIPVCYVDSASGNTVEYHSISTQQTPATLSTGTQSGNLICESKGTQAVISAKEKMVSVGSSICHLVASSVQCSIEKKDFSCGKDIAEIVFKDVEIQTKHNSKNMSTNTEILTQVDAAITCDLHVETRSVGVGDGSVFDAICEKCNNTSTIDSGVGTYLDGQYCGIFDKLCHCIKPEMTSTGVGENSVEDVCCDLCANRNLVSIGVGNCKINDLFCEMCDKPTKANKGVGSTSINDPLFCDICQKKPKTEDKGVGEMSENNLVSIGVGEYNVLDENCSKCKSNTEENIFNFDLNIINKPPVTQQAVLCHYCGNKVDLNDEHLDESLQAMRESMQTIRSGMKRSSATKNLNIDVDDEENLETHHKVESAEGSVSDDYHSIISDEEEESVNSGRNDVIEACQMLHQHFSGEKPLKQQQMLKYMGIIQVLWFKTVKKRRANASVVKSYIDLFQQRIPELMETIINLTDDEGNTALHYALTYKNYGVASILLDSRECAVDLVNQAGYSPIMLAALAGFEKKNDKYIMQRLLRMGDINKESADTGQTPLMLAVTRGNLGMTELLLDAGCDINATDDEGSTALMCACEHGNINIVKALLGHPGCDVTIEDNEGSTALSIAMDSRRKDLALLIYGSLNFDARGRIKLSPSKQSLLGLGRRSPSPVIGRR